MNIIKKIFRQRTATLCNGEVVRAGDKVSFIGSDGVRHVDTIKYHPDYPDRLYFWNTWYQIKDYPNAKKEQ